MDRFWCWCVVVAWLGLVLGIGGFLRHAITRPAEASWSAYLRVADEALLHRDGGTARRAWREAHAAALGDGGWDALVEVGDAALRLESLVGPFEASRAHAREAYGQALLRARAHGSVEGVQRVAEAFEALGDHDASGQTLALARDMARQPRVP